MDLETRTCPSCKKSFKTLTASKQVFCTQRCVEFLSGKQHKFNKKTILDFKRQGFTHKMFQEIK